MAYSNAEVIDYLIANPNMSDADIVSAMETFRISPSQMAEIAGVPVGEIVARVADVIPQGSNIILGDTIIQPEYRITGSGETQEIGPLETIYTSKTTGDVNYRAPVGSEIQQYGADGTFIGTGKVQEVNALKDFMDFALTAGTLFGLPSGIGNALGLTGAAGQAVGQGLLTTGTKLGGGASVEEALKAGLLGGGLVYGGSQLADYISANTPVNAANMTQAQFNDAIEGKLVSDLQTAGLSKDQINAFLDDMGIGQGLTTAIPQVATTSPVTDGGGITITAPTTTPALNNVLNTISTVPTVNVTATKPQQVSQDVLDAVTTQLVSNQSTVPTVNITGQKPTTVNDVITALTTTGILKDIPTVDIATNRPITSKTDLDSVITSLITANTPITTTKTIDTTIPTVDVVAKKPVIGDTLAAITTIPSTLTTTTETPVKTTKEIVDTKKDTTLTTSDIIKLISVVPAIAAISKIATPTTTPTGFDVVPIPASFGNPPAPSVAPYSPLAPINFGTRNLLKGTNGRSS